MELETFFGRIKFNAFRRNVGNDPATTQVLERKEHKKSQHNSSLKVATVLPVRAAKAELVMPSENLYKPTCLPGHYVGPNSFDPCQPCDPGKFSNENNASHCDRCPTGSYISEKGQSEYTLCPNGTTTDGPGAKNLNDCYCMRGFFHDKGEIGMECSACPDGAICNGRAAAPVPMEGYWMNDTMRTVAYECDPQYVCIGGSEIACKSGHTGR